MESAVRIRCVSLIALLTVSEVSAQGLAVTMRQTQGQETTQLEMQIDPTHVRADVGREGLVAVYDASTDTVRLLDSVRRSYRELTRTQAEQLGKQVAVLLTIVQAQLEKLPPDQRAAMEATIKARGGELIGGAPQTPLTYTRTGTSTVGNWPCTTYDGVRDGRKVLEICASEGAAIGVTPEDFQAVRKLADLVRAVMPRASDGLVVYGTAADGFAGVPLRRTSFTDGVPETTTEIVAVNRQTMPASAFDVPAGFTRQELLGNFTR